MTSGTAVLGLLLAAVGPLVSAQPGTPSTSGPAAIVVLAPLCPHGAVSFVSFIDALRVELANEGPKCCEIGTREQTAARDDRDDRVRVVLAIEPCGATALNMKIEVGGAGRALRHELSFADIAPAARPRALSLAVAELVRALGREPGPGPTAESAPPTSVLVSRSAPRPESSAEPPRHFRVAAQTELRFYPTLATTLWGGRASLSVERQRWHGAIDVGWLFIVGGWPSEM